MKLKPVVSLYKPLNSLILPIVGNVYWKLACLLVSNGLVIEKKNISLASIYLL